MGGSLQPLRHGRRRVPMYLNHVLHRTTACTLAVALSLVGFEWGAPAQSAQARAKRAASTSKTRKAPVRRAAARGGRIVSWLASGGRTHEGSTGGTVASAKSQGGGKGGNGHGGGTSD